MKDSDSSKGTQLRSNEVSAEREALAPTEVSASEMVVTEVSASGASVHQLTPHVSNPRQTAEGCRGGVRWSPVATENRRMAVEPLEPVWFGELDAGCGHRLADIDLRANRPPWSAISFENEFNNPAHAIIYGARYRGQIIGFGVIHYVVPEAHLLNLAVAQEYRGMGVGTRLLSHICASLRTKQMRQLTLEVRRSNTTAQQLYAQFGFEQVGERKKYYPDDGEDALVLKAEFELLISTLGVRRVAA